MTTQVKQILSVLREAKSRYNKWDMNTFEVDARRYTWWKKNTPNDMANLPDNMFEGNSTQQRVSKAKVQELSFCKASNGLFKPENSGDIGINATEGDAIGEFMNVDLKVGHGDKLARIGSWVPEHLGTNSKKPHYIVDCDENANRALIIDISDFKDRISDEDFVNFNDWKGLPSEVIEEKLSDFIFEI